MTQETHVEGTRLTIRRQFAAPVERLYQAWTDPAKVCRWFIPNVRWKEPTVDIDVRPGGKYSITLNHSDGDAFHNTGQYVEVVPNQRLSFTFIWAEAPTGPEETLVTVEFRSVAGGSELTLIHDRLVEPVVRENTTSGWSGCLDMLDRYLSETAASGV